MRSQRRLISFILLIWYLPACTYTTRLEPKTAVEGQKTVLVTVTSGADTLTWMVDRPWVNNDSLYGRAAACQDCPRGAQWPVPLSAVTETRAYHDFSGKATAAVFGIALVAGLLALARAMSQLGY